VDCDCRICLLVAVARAFVVAPLLGVLGVPLTIWGLLDCGFAAKACETAAPAVSGQPL
jgi:hypothetical protein